MAKTSKKTLQTSEAKTSETPKTKAKKTKEDSLGSRLVAEVSAPDGTIFQKAFEPDRFPVSVVFVQMNAPKSSYHKTWHILCFTSNEKKANRDLNRVTRKYIEEKNPSFEMKRYLDVSMSSEIKKVEKLEKPEDRSCFKAAKIARGDLKVSAKKEDSKEAKTA